MYKILYLTPKELEWLVDSEISYIKPVIQFVEDYCTDKYIEMSFKFNNEIYSISYRYTISNGLSFPDDLLDSFPKIKFC